MLIFFGIFCPGLIASMLLFSGTGHLLRFKRFTQLIGDHEVIPRVLGLPLAVLILLLEWALGLAMLWTLLRDTPLTLRLGLAMASAALGAAFMTYLILLLRKGPVQTSCGCSPLSSPLTEASLVPAGTLLVGSLIALAMWSASPSSWHLVNLGIDTGMALMAAVSMAGLAFLLPASMPAALETRREA